MSRPARDENLVATRNRVDVAVAAADMPVAAFVAPQRVFARFERTGERDQRRPLSGRGNCPCAFLFTKFYGKPFAGGVETGGGAALGAGRT